jgi:hypothetical protein
LPVASKTHSRAVQRQIDLTTAVCQEKLLTTHVRHAIAMVDLVSDTLPFDDALDIYVRILRLNSEQARNVGSRALAELGRRSGLPVNNVNLPQPEAEDEGGDGGQGGQAEPTEPPAPPGEIPTVAERRQAVEEKISDEAMAAALASLNPEAQDQDPEELLDAVRPFADLTGPEVAVLPSLLQFYLPTITCEQLNARPAGSIQDPAEIVTSCDTDGVFTYDIVGVETAASYTDEWGDTTHAQDAYVIVALEAQNTGDAPDTPAWDSEFETVTAYDAEGRAFAAD